MAVTTPTTGSRLGTLNPGDFAFWASTLIAEGAPGDYDDDGGETDGLAMVSWAATQTGVNFAVDYSTAVLALSENMLDTADALRVRGALLVGLDGLAVCMGLQDVVGVINGRYFQYVTAPGDRWRYGAMLPGLEY